MKKNIFEILSKSILLTLFIAQFSFSQNNFKTWTQTTVSDFSANKLSDLIITNVTDGEVQLPRCLIKKVEDHIDDSLFRFVAKDGAGNFVRTWTQGNNIFVKKYSAEWKEVTKSVQVNEINGVTGDLGESRAAIFDDGTYIVVWSNLASIIGQYGDMYGQIYKDDSIKVGSNFKINEKYNSSACHPVALANDSDNNFWILYNLNVTPDAHKIYIQKRDKSGAKIGETFFPKPSKQHSI